MLMLLYGCCAIETQSKFANDRSYWVGHRMSDGWYKGFIESSKGQTDVGDGDIEYDYIHGQCKYSFVINSDTQIVKSWHYNSKPEHCVANSCGAW